MIGDSSPAGQLLPRNVNCTIAGEGVGTQHTLTYADGTTQLSSAWQPLGEAVQRLKLQPADRNPLWQRLTGMATRDLIPNWAELAWSASFQAGGIPGSEAVALLEGAPAANCPTLKQVLEH